jgi:uncharacterized protein (TIGR03000 family)
MRKRLFGMWLGAIFGVPSIGFGVTTFHITVPTIDTQVFIGGELTSQQGNERLFSYDTENLNPAKTYYYDIKAVLETDHDDELEKSIAVEFHSGDMVRVMFTLNDGILVASYTSEIPSYPRRFPSYISLRCWYTGYCPEVADYSGYSTGPYVPAPIPGHR